MAGRTRKRRCCAITARDEWRPFCIACSIFARCWGAHEEKFFLGGGLTKARAKLARSIGPNCVLLVDEAQNLHEHDARTRLMGAGFEWLRACQEFGGFALALCGNPRVLGQNKTVRIEMTVDDARKLARAAKVFDDGLSDAEGAFRFLAAAVQDGVEGYDLSCALSLMQRGLTSPEREEDMLLRLHKVLAFALHEGAPDDANQKGESDADQ